MRENLLNFEDLENLKLAEDLAKTCVEMYSVTSTGLAPEIAYFNMEVGWTNPFLLNLRFKDQATSQEICD